MYVGVYEGVVLRIGYALHAKIWNEERGIKGRIKRRNVWWIKRRKRRERIVFSRERNHCGKRSRLCYRPYRTATTNRTDGTHDLVARDSLSRARSCLYSHTKVCIPERAQVAPK